MLYFFLAAVLLLPVSFRLLANTEKDALCIQAELVLLKKIKIRLYSDSITVKKALTSIFSRKKKKLNIARIFNSVKKHTKIKRLIINSRLGTGNAASTALVSGQAFGIVAPLVASLSKKDYSVDIVPDFSEKTFSFSGECIISTNVVKTLFIIINILGGIKNGKASH